MGLIDEIHCKKKLPDDAPEFVKQCPVFQTYNLGRGMGSYIIDEEGRFFSEGSGVLQMLAYEFKHEITPVLLPYKRKRIEMYAGNLRGGSPRNGKQVWFTEDGSDYIEITYIVQIRNGKVSSIKEKHRNQQPARPISEM